MAYQGIEARLIKAGVVNIGAYLSDLYVTQKKTLRQMLPILKTSSVAAVSRLMRKHGVAPRKGGEAVAVQWINNESRRKRTSATMRSTMLKRAEAGEHWALGHTKESHPGVASTASKLAERKWLTQPDVMARAIGKKKARHRADPTTHTQARVKPTVAELRVAEWLQRHGLECQPQKPVIVGDALYFADLFVPSLNLIVEVSKTVDRVPVERIRAFRGAGFETLAVRNTVPESGKWQNADDAISRAKVGQFHPSTVRECWVSPGAKKGVAATEAYLDQFIG